MKKVIFALFLMSLFGFVLQSCCKDDDDPPNGPTHLQTILVYMPWSGDATYTGLYDAFQKNLKDIESAIVKENGLYGTTRVLVFITDSIRKSDLKPMSQLYEILFDEKSKTCIHNLIKTYSGEVDYTTAEGIATILRDAENGAGQTLDFHLIIGCHGSGWTQKDIWNNYPYNAKRHSLMAKRKQPAAIGDATGETTRFFGSTADRLYATDIETLAEGIRLSGIRHVGYILFDDCYMANVEVAYELRNVADVLLASTSEILSEGMPYADMWKFLVSRNYNDGYAGVVNSFYQYYSKRFANPCGAIAAIDCHQMDELAAIMRQINSNDTFDEAQMASLQQLDGFLDSSQADFDRSGTDFVPIFFDMGDYVSKLCTDPALYEKFKAQLSKVVLNKAATKQIYSTIYGIFYPKRIDVNTFSGITISDPSQHFVALRGKERTSWWKATH